MSSQPRIDQQITFLYTRDLAGTAQFYEEVLGLRLWLDQGTCRIYAVTDTALVGFCERDTVPDPPAGVGNDRVIITIVSQDVDGWYTRLKEAGVHFTKEPAVNPVYNIYHCFLRDPNGYLVEIQRFL